MTTSVATDIITVSAETITVNSDGTFSIQVKNVTDLTDALLAARKEAYENLRGVKAAEKAQRDSERAAKKEERKAIATAKREALITKTEKRLAELKAAKRAAGRKSGRKSA